MFTRTRKPSALAAGFIFLGLAVSGCELADPVGPSALPAVSARNITNNTQDPVQPPQAAVPTLDQDSGGQLSPLCGIAAASVDQRSFRAQGPGGRPVCR